MKAHDFRGYSSPERLNALVEATLKGEALKETIKTPDGGVYRTIKEIPVSRADIWSVIKSPTLIARHIPGLDDFVCQGIQIDTPITEQHKMFFSTNAYEGRLFHYDPRRKVWGMTNHPVNGNNLFDIPHNVVYHLNEQDAKVSIGVDYCASGRLELLPILHTLAGLVARVSMDYALSKVAKALTNGNK